MFEIHNKITQLLSIKVNIENGYKATSLDGHSTCAISTNKKEEIKFNIGKENELTSTKIIAPSVAGYHYCEFLSEVLLYRPIDGKINKKNNREQYFVYYKIKATGECFKSRRDPEIVTNKFIPIEKIEKAEMLSILKEEKNIFIEHINDKRKRKKYETLIKIIDETIQYINENPRFIHF